MYPDEDRDVNLVIDAMFIKKAKLWDNLKGKFIGFPDYGAMTLISDDANLKENISNEEKNYISRIRRKISFVRKAKNDGDNLATEALVFMAVRLCGT